MQVLGSAQGNPCFTQGKHTKIYTHSYYFLIFFAYLKSNHHPFRHICLATWFGKETLKDFLSSTDSVGYLRLLCILECVWLYVYVQFMFDTKHSRKTRKKKQQQHTSTETQLNGRGTEKECAHRANRDVRAKKQQRTKKASKKEKKNKLGAECIKSE